jgi:hypothetical protein
MKDERIIRSHLENVKTIGYAPCDCPGDEHVGDCAVGHRMMSAVLAFGYWLLDENPEFDRMDEELARRSGEVRRAQRG